MTRPPTDEDAPKEMPSVPTKHAVHSQVRAVEITNREVDMHCHLQLTTKSEQTYGIPFLDIELGWRKGFLDLLLVRRIIAPGRGRRRILHINILGNIRHRSTSMFQSLPSLTVSSCGQWIRIRLCPPLRLLVSLSGAV